MRHVHPFGRVTIFNDNNDLIAAVGENPLADSQFEFDSDDADFVLDASESNVDLSATMVGLGPLDQPFTLAHIVVADGVPGTWTISVVQSEGPGGGKEYQLSGVFGPSNGVTGDYNSNGTVDAADYVLWRHTLGQAGMGLAADGDGSQLIDDGDYVVWKSSFGHTGGSSAAQGRAVVPEPVTWLMMLFAALLTSRRSLNGYCRTV
jgi:hypothetical protein